MKLRCNCKELARAIKKIGFRCVRKVGSHHTYKHSDGRTVVIPFHSGEELGPGLLLNIVKWQLGISRKEFLKLLKK